MSLRHRMREPLTTRDVYIRLDLTEPALRHVLRRPGAPRPASHPSARIFMWTEEDVRRLEEFLQKPREPSESMVGDR